MEKTNYYVIKVLSKSGDWYTNALIENSFDAIQVCKLYCDQLGYTVQLWHKEEDVSFLLNAKTAAIG